MLVDLTSSSYQLLKCLGILVFFTKMNYRWICTCTLLSLPSVPLSHQKATTTPGSVLGNLEHALWCSVNLSTPVWNWVYKLLLSFLSWNAWQMSLKESFILVLFWLMVWGDSPSRQRRNDGRSTRQLMSGITSPVRKQREIRDSTPLPFPFYLVWDKEWRSLPMRAGLPSSAKSLWKHPAWHVHGFVSESGFKSC